MFSPALVLTQFFCRHPALYYGLLALSAVYFVLLGTYLALLPPLYFALLLGPFAGRPRRLLLSGFLLFVLTSLYLTAHYRCPDLAGQSLQGRGLLQIESVSQRRGHKGSYFVYRGVLCSFKGEKGELLRLAPVQFRYSGRQRPPADQNYWVRGGLKSQGPYRYLLKLNAKQGLEPAGSWSLAERRFQAKSAIKNQLEEVISDPQVSRLLIGLATGELDDRLLRMEFANLGVQHVLAISGFHFAILATMLHFILRGVLGRKALSLALGLLLSSYYLFLGTGPSIQRAWISVCLVLWGTAMGRRTRSLNLLGVALLILLVDNPLQALQRGFQYSFLATVGILLLYPLLAEYFAKLLPRRPFFQIVEMSTVSQHCYLLTSYFREAFSLTLSVHLLMVPLLLYHQHCFPLWGLVANLFLPFLISGVLLLLFAAILLGSLFPALAEGVHGLNAWLLSWVLDWVQQSPSVLALSYYSQFWSPLAIIIYQMLVLSLAAVNHEGQTEEARVSRSFCFV